MDQPKVQLVDKLKAANYVLVTVSNNPSVDQLAALIGLTLLLTKSGKHAAAVFSGEVPSTLEFLKPEDTIEKTTDSLRDFIIALDKSKADKLRYKVEDDVVRIFITPYKTSISADDLEFSQGDFNVDVVIALGVTKQEDLDQAIVTHGRILHDATVATLNISEAGDFGSIHWQNAKASSLSEMVSELARLLGENLIDNQIATALLTGIVAETNRFSNEKTTAQVMSVSAALMAAGANQQLVATQLAQSADSARSAPMDPVVSLEPAPVDVASEPVLEVPASDGSFEIKHNDTAPAPVDAADEEIFTQPNLPSEETEAEQPETVAMAEPEQIVAVENPDQQSPAVEHMSGGSKLITEPPMLGGQLTANSHVEVLEPSSDPLSAPPNTTGTILTRNAPMATIEERDLAPSELPVTLAPDPEPATEQQHAMISGLTPPPPAWVAPFDNPLDLPESPQTLSDLEAAVRETEPSLVDDARNEVMRALANDVAQPLKPVEALGAQPMMDNLNTQPAAGPTAVEQPLPPEPSLSFIDSLPQQIPSLPLPPASNAVPAVDPAATTFDPSAFGIASTGAPIPGTPAPQVIDPNAAPPVPPPMPFNFGPPPTPPQS